LAEKSCAIVSLVTQRLIIIVRNRDSFFIINLFLFDCKSIKKINRGCGEIEYSENLLPTDSFEIIFANEWVFPANGFETIFHEGL
jgi:hypothetical protein